MPTARGRGCALSRTSWAEAAATCSAGKVQLAFPSLAWPPPAPSSASALDCLFHVLLCFMPAATTAPAAVGGVQISSHVRLEKQYARGWIGQLRLWPRGKAAAGGCAGLQVPCLSAWMEAEGQPYGTCLQTSCSLRPSERNLDLEQTAEDAGAVCSSGARSASKGVWGC